MGFLYKIVMRFLLLLAFLIPAIAFAQIAETAPNATQEELAAREASIVPDDPYTISDVVVDVTADNAVDARAQAFEKGAKLAVEKFLALQGADIDVDRVDADKLVRDFQVNEERFSKTRYTAVLTYRFKPNAMAGLVNPALPAEQALPVPEEPIAAEQPEQGQMPVDYDQPWSPTQAGTRSAPPTTQDQQRQAAGGLSTWPLTVRFSDVAQWLQAQSLITARPEIRGMKIISMSGDIAQIEVTTEGSVGEVQRKWNSFGWNAYPQGAGLSVDAAALGH